MCLYLYFIVYLPNSVFVSLCVVVALQISKYTSSEGY